MALTIGDYNGIGTIAYASSTTESISTSGTNRWNEDGAGTDSWTTDTYLQGGESFAGAYSNKSGYQYYVTSTSYNFTAGGNAEGQYIWIWVNCPTIGLLNTLANNGLAIRIGNDLSNYRDYTIAGNNDSNGWLGDWKCFVIDPTQAGTTGQGAGTFNPNNVNYIGVWIDTIAIAKGDNIFIDQIAIATGIDIVGTSTNGWQETAAFCSDYANQAIGALQEKSGIYYTQGTINIGTSGQTAATSFQDAGRIIKFDTSQYWTGSAWASTYPTTAAGINITDNASFSTTYEDGIIVGTDNGRAGTTIIGSSDQDAYFDLSGLVNASSDVNLYGSTFKQFNGGINLAADADHVAYGCVFNSSEQFIPNATIIRNCTISETSSTSGGLLWSSGVNIQNSNFIANTTGAAIQIATDHGADGEEDFSALFFSGNTFDVNNTTGSALTVNKLALSNPSTYTGSLVTFAASYSYTIKGLALNTEVTIVTAGTNTELFHVEDATVSDGLGEGTYQVTYPHSGGATVDVLVHEKSYQPDVSNIYGVTLPNADSEAKVQMFLDLNYLNP